MNQTTAKYLFEGIAADVVRYLVELNGMEIKTAITTFYNSEAFSKLKDFETELYTESPAYIYSMLLDEIEYKGLRQ